MQDADYIADANKSKLIVEYVSGEEAEKLVAQIYSMPPQVKEMLGGNPQTKTFGDKLESFSGGLTLTQDVQLAVRIQTTDPGVHPISVERMYQILRAHGIRRAEG